MTDEHAQRLRDEHGHAWGTPYYGHRTCQLCGRPDSSSRATETCLNPHGIVATDDEIKAAAKKVRHERKALLDNLSKR